MSLVTKWALTVCIFSMVGVLQAAPKAPDAELAASAQRSLFRTNDQSAIGEAMRKAQLQLSDRAKRDPNGISGATVLLSSGLNSTELGRLLQSINLEVFRIETKVPVGSSGRVITVSTGADDLLMFNGTLEQRLEKAIGQQRYRFLLDSRSASGVDATDFEEFARTRRIGVFRADVVGANNSLARLLADGRVAAVVLDESNQIRDGHAATKAAIDRRRVGSSSVTTRPPPGQVPAPRGTLKRDELQSP